MKVIEIVPFNFYSCQNCGGLISSQVVYEIILGIKPVCSIKCLFGLVYRIINSYDEKTLDYLKNRLNIKEIEPDSRQNLVYAITKKYYNLVLPSVNHFIILSLSEKLIIDN